jgi:hypothetical protein
MEGNVEDETQNIMQEGLEYKGEILAEFSCFSFIYPNDPPRALFI